ncbi:YhcN/YlaJ family sporulation lipoprotein [Ornithinibacillus sp. BX22]|uniref:YhcN/YlaJ family sporulation lipoprotein n=2 Tax=Ornithinibacillus TaxID=484508 RepID=A0A923RHH2_9BACI|nr:MULTISPECIES: YhcN/YlaJ family sporulation lipoprotein [Ornithinibacillus]MBC5636575.1 YhcN/YlaJ family sporulation lipoprotein [Ornithinibacillus hominis]MBS3680583.1 YhcN/YlaJ family sporulation lipoprotein [Ornithinibacillus massiliensis]
MKKQLITVAAAALFIVSGCAADNEEGQRGTDNNNIEPVRYQNHPDGIGTRDNRNYTMQRDLEEPNRFRNINNPGNNNTRNINNTNEQTNANRYDVAEEAADLIVQRINVIDNAYVLTTDNNAYVAAELDTHQNGNNLNHKDGELTDEVKEKISSIVKSVDNNIDNVYVSTNPDFMDLADNYARDVDEGRPIEGFFEEIGNMIERVFPQNR